MPEPILAPLPPDAVGPDRAVWVQRVRDAWLSAASDARWAFALLARLNRDGCRGWLTPEERERLERIERGVSYG